ncbi:hypothetical protein FOCC_FOCC009155 [Frankliniella occidentalis]|uniref:Uncharacterized protein LOC113203183 n=1 Tax=Frankliniella occidentalis TaxID=133901 RepID=A0A6J1S2Y1_FRAOC|nr:uncharacterized protein LOC113203183 [Frankliniella occidentalis]KAE8744236.1 hypothetical protein FOCC_FOCC009155 [Frankliniella occidentalis]
MPPRGLVLAAALAVWGVPSSAQVPDLSQFTWKSHCIKLSGIISINDAKGSDKTSVPPPPGSKFEAWCNDDGATASLSWNEEELNIFISIEKGEENLNRTKFNIYQFQYLQRDSQGVASCELIATPQGYRSYVDGGMFCNTTLPMIPYNSTMTTTTLKMDVPTTASSTQAETGTQISRIERDLSEGGSTEPSIHEVTISGCDLEATLNLASFTIILKRYDADIDQQPKFVSTCLVQPDITLITSISGVVTGVILFGAAMLAVNVHCK